MSSLQRYSLTIFVSAVIVTLSCISASCAQKATASALVPKEYSSWRRSTAVELNYPIPGHGESIRTIFMNPEGFLFQQQAGSAEFPLGTIVIKEMRPLGAVTADMPAPTLTVMIKAPDDERARGGWLWIMKDTVTQTETVFSNDFCYRCHSNANEAHPYADRNPSGAFRDFVFFVPGLDTPAVAPEDLSATGGALEAAVQPSGNGY